MDQMEKEISNRNCCDLAAIPPLGQKSQNKRLHMIKHRMPQYMNIMRHQQTVTKIFLTHIVTIESNVLCKPQEMDKRINKKLRKQKFHVTRRSQYVPRDIPPRILVCRILKRSGGNLFSLVQTQVSLQPKHMNRQVISG